MSYSAVLPYIEFRMSQLRIADFSHNSQSKEPQESACACNSQKRNKACTVSFARHLKPDIWYLTFIIIHHTSLTSLLIDLIGQQLQDIQNFSIQHQACTVFQVVFLFFYLFKKVSKEKRAMLDGTNAQSDVRNTEGCSPTIWLSFHGSMGVVQIHFIQEKLATPVRDVKW